MWLTDTVEAKLGGYKLPRRPAYIISRAIQMLIARTTRAGNWHVAVCRMNDKPTVRCCSREPVTSQLAYPGRCRQGAEAEFTP